MSTPASDVPERESPRNEPNDLEQKLADYARVGLPALTVVIAVVAGVVQGVASGILVLAGGALIGVIAVFWASVRTLLGETPLSGADAYALAAPRAEEERKRAVLRALKDLEFERSVGKISEADYAELVARYRGEAKRLLRAIDEAAQPRHERAEALLAKRLRREGLLKEGPAAKTTTSDVNDVNDVNDDSDVNDADRVDDSVNDADRAAAPGDRDPKSAASGTRPTKGKKRKKPRVETPAPNAPTRACAECSTKNDPDAIFCKKCGTRQQAEAEPDAEAEADAEATAATTSDDKEDAS